jgi:mono/diheme cytochrome c family protein
MQSRFLALAALAGLGSMLAIGCSKSADTSSSSGTSATTASAAPAAGASGDTSNAATSEPAAGASADSAMGSSTTQTVAAAGDTTKGEAIFAANCASCHGEKGAGGGVGPTLKGEKSRKDTAAAIAWIKNPQPPMPKLYPSPLSQKDVADVAAYVESL